MMSNGSFSAEEEVSRRGRGEKPGCVSDSWVPHGSNQFRLPEHKVYSATAEAELCLIKVNVYRCIQKTQRTPAARRLWLSQPDRPCAGSVAAFSGTHCPRDTVWLSCYFQENAPETSGLNLNREWEPVPEESASKIKRLTIICSSDGQGRSEAILFNNVTLGLQCRGFRGKVSMRNSNLFCTCHFTICLLPLWHSTRVFQTQ